METKLVWHDYSEEEPSESGSYLVVVYTGSIVDPWGESNNLTAQLVRHFSVEQGCFNTSNVVYWAELAYPSVVEKDSYYMDKDKNLNNPPYLGAVSAPKLG